MRTSASTPGATSWLIARTSKKGWCGATSRGKARLDRRPSTPSTTQACPAHSAAGCSTQKPMRFFRKLEPAVPSIV